MGEAWTLLWAFLGALAGSVASEVIAALVRKSQGAEKHRDDDLTELLESLATVRTLAETYWQKSAAELGDQEMPMRSQITANLHHISAIYSAMFTGQPKRDCDVAYTPLMRAVAEGSFGNDDRPSEPERLVLIHQTALSFRRAAIMCRRELKRPPLA